MIGGGFQHQNSVSINGSLPKDFKWVRGITSDYDIEMYIDSSIELNLNKNKKNRCAWLFESEKIYPIDWILNNVDVVSNSYEFIFTHNKKLLSLGKNFVFVPANGVWIKEPKIIKKTRLVSMISSNKSQTDGHKKRLSVVEKYRNDVDMFGSGINPIKLKEEGLSDYMFSVVVENGRYDDYFTEKILDCFAVGTIPVYWGCNSIGKYFDGGGIITLTDDFDVATLSKELYQSKSSHIENNFNKINQYTLLEDWILKYINPLRYD